jgi:hypothetical protein
MFSLSEIPKLLVMGMIVIITIFAIKKLTAKIENPIVRQVMDTV